MLSRLFALACELKSHATLFELEATLAGLFHIVSEVSVAFKDVDTTEVSPCSATGVLRTDYKG